MRRAVERVALATLVSLCLVESCAEDRGLSPAPRAAHGGNAGAGAGGGAGRGGAAGQHAAGGESAAGGAVEGAGAAGASGASGGRIAGPVDGGRALFGVTDGQHATQVIAYEHSLNRVFALIPFDHANVKISGKRGIVRYLEQERGHIWLPDESYNYTLVVSSIDVNPWAIPPGFVAPDGGVLPQTGDSPDAGPPGSSFPVAVVQGPDEDDFVLCRERADVVHLKRVEGVSLIDRTIDISALSLGDGDGKSEPVDGLLDPTGGHIYVLLARVDRRPEASPSWPSALPRCADAKAGLASLDARALSLDDLDGASEARHLALAGSSPVSLQLEPESQRLFMLFEGCQGEGGAVVGRGLQTFSLSEKTLSPLVPIDVAARPTALVIEGPSVGLVAFDDLRIARLAMAGATIASWVKQPPSPFGVMGESGWIIGMDPTGAYPGLYLIDPANDERHDMFPFGPFSLPGATPMRDAYAWQ